MPKFYAIHYDGLKEIRSINTIARTRLIGLTPKALVEIYRGREVDQYPDDDPKSEIWLRLINACIVNHYVVNVLEDAGWKYIVSDNVHNTDSPKKERPSDLLPRY